MRFLNCLNFKKNINRFYVLLTRSSIVLSLVSFVLVYFFDINQLYLKIITLTFQGSSALFTFFIEVAPNSVAEIKEFVRGIKREDLIEFDDNLILDEMNKHILTLMMNIPESEIVNEPFNEPPSSLDESIIQTSKTPRDITEGNIIKTPRDVNMNGHNDNLRTNTFNIKDYDNKTMIEMINNA